MKAKKGSGKIRNKMEICFYTCFLYVFMINLVYRSNEHEVPIIMRNA